MHNTWENGRRCNACLSLTVPSASFRRRSRHLHGLKGTLSSMQYQGGGWGREEKLWSPELQVIIVGLSLPPPFFFRCILHPLYCQTACSRFASIFLSPPVGSHQSVNLPWILAWSTNCTIYLNTLTAITKKISEFFFSNPQLGKQPLSENPRPSDKFKLTCNNKQHLMGIFAPQQKPLCICWQNDMHSNCTYCRWFDLI